ncbi:MAG: hypothetical protein IKP67_02645, partial [Spirochaetales bacterium]|nr:hypothetical protein [Spirochaetales bacterium]
GSLKSNAAIRIDTVSPTITNVKTLTPNGSYSTHSNITTVEIQVIFSENVLISGTPRLKLNATNGGSSCYAVYDGKNVDESGNPKASNKATFIYTIKSGDTTNNVPLTWKEWDDNGSTITDTANSGRKDNNIVSGNPFDVPDKDLSIDFIDSHQWSQKIYIDTTAPVITGITLSNADSLQQQYDSADHAYYCNAGKKINLAVDFSEAVNITSSPTIEFADNITTKALYTSGKGSSRLIFSYTVTDNDNTSSGLYLKVKNIANSIQDNAGNPMNAALPNGGVLDKNIIIDTNKPAKPAVTYTAASNAVHNYEGAAVNVYTGLSAGNTIGVTLASTTDTSSYQYCWTENNIALGWETGSGNISKTFGSGKAEGFYQEYYVSLQLRDKAGNLSDESDVKHFIIDTDKPKLTGVSTTAVSGSSLIASESGIYMTGEKINISLEFNKSVTVSSPLTIRLSNGKELTIDTGTEAKHLEGNSAYYLTKEYTVASSDTDTTKLDITSISSGEVKDDLNNTLSAAALTS